MILQVKNEKYKIFVRSGYYTFFKPREYILVINITKGIYIICYKYQFLCSRLSIVTRLTIN